MTKLRNTAVRLAAAVILVTAGTVVALASPAAAAPLLFIINGAGGCLEQGYFDDGYPSIDVYAAECDRGVNQMWRMEPQTATTFMVVNELSGRCLSAPNDPTGNPYVYAETCTGARKQVWGASSTVLGMNLLVSQRWTSWCLTYRTDNNHATLAGCEGSVRRGNWYWR